MQCLWNIYKKNERIKTFKEAGDWQCIYQNELDKACFQHNVAYRDFKDLTSGTDSDKMLRFKAFISTKNLKYDVCQRGLASVVYKFFHKEYANSSIKNEVIFNKKLAEELHKPIIRNFKKIKVHSTFIDLADMQLISKFDKGFTFLLYFYYWHLYIICMGYSFKK